MWIIAEIIFYADADKTCGTVCLLKLPHLPPQQQKKAERKLLIACVQNIWFRFRCRLIIAPSYQFFMVALYCTPSPKKYFKGNAQRDKVCLREILFERPRLDDNCYMYLNLLFLS
jgi:hypothetical protein